MWLILLSTKTVNKSKMGCSICKSEDQDELFAETLEASEWTLNNTKYGYQACRNCGFIQCKPLPPEGDLIDFYRYNYAYEWFQSNSPYKKMQAKHRLYKIRKHLKGVRKLLDFGCGHGFFVEAAAEKDLQSYGFDIGVEKIISSKGYHIVNKNSFSEYHENGFDLITAWHVIEHMRDVNRVISELKDSLNHNGKIVIAVPNTGSLGFRMFRQKWGWIQQPYVHINHFNYENLSQLLNNHNFEVISISTTDTWDQNLYDLLITKFFYKDKSRNAVRKFEKSLKGTVVFRMNQVARLLFTPVSYAYSYLRKSKKEGSELLIVAQKK